MGSDASILAAVVIPFLNERMALPGTLECLALSARTSGVNPSALSVIGVDNGSSDNSAEILIEKAENAGFGAVTVVESSGGVVSARSRGFREAIARHPRARLLVSLDADTHPGPAWLREAMKLRDGGADAVSFIGTFPNAFWTEVPRLTRKYASDVGTIFFDSLTASDFEYSERGFHQNLFAFFGRALVDQLFALTPQAYEKAGGYEVRTTDDGAELLHEGGRLSYQIAMAGGRTSTALVDRYTTSPRRLVGEAADLFSGAAYEGSLQQYRVEAGGALRALDSSVDHLNFADLRRYVIRNYLIFQLLCQPGLTKWLPAFLPVSVSNRVKAKVMEARASSPDSAAAIEASAYVDGEIGRDVEAAWFDRGRV